MIGHREMSVDDYLGILRRRLWWLVIPAVLGPLIAYGVSLTLPDRYTSQTLVLVEQQKVPESYVRSIVNDELNQRLGTMKEQILSRTRLQPIIERHELWKAEWKTAPMEELVGRLRKGIAITPVKPVTTTRKEELPGFFISVTMDNARLTQQVCTEITSMFMEENLRLREQRAVGTTEFLSKQLDEAKRKLDEQDSRLANFKRRYIAQMPGQEQANMNILMGLTSQLEAVTQLVNRTQQDKTYMESQLALQLNSWQSSQAGNNPQTLEQQLIALRNQLITLEGRYTGDHPDIVKLKADIAQLEKKIAEGTVAAKESEKEKKQAATASEPLQIQQLRNQIRLAEQIIKEKTRDQERIQDQIKVYQARVQFSPVVEQEFKEITRDYQTALDFYNDLLKKKTESEMATELERRQQGEQFRVMDPANLPETPSYPNRPMIAAGGLGGGLALGLGIVLLLEIRDKSLRTDRDVEFFLGVPALGLVPMVGEGNGQGHRGWFWKRPGKQANQTVHTEA